jgi:uncharacterized membrane protein YccC
MADYEYKWIVNLPEPLRSTLAEILRDQEKRAENCLRALMPRMKKIDAEAVLFATLTRMANGDDNYVHPDLPLAALKLLDEVIKLREKLQHYETPPTEAS